MPPMVEEKLANALLLHKLVGRAERRLREHYRILQEKPRLKAARCWRAPFLRTLLLLRLAPAVAPCANEEEKRKEQQLHNAHLSALYLLVQVLSTEVLTFRLPPSCSFSLSFFLQVLQVNVRDNSFH